MERTPCGPSAPDGGRRPVNEALDWPNIVEEIESVGNEQHHAVTSPLVQAVVHILKVQAWPQSRRFRIEAEARGFRDDTAIVSRHRCGRELTWSGFINGHAAGCPL